MWPSICGARMPADARGGAACNSTRIDEADARAARRELVGDGAAHDAAPTTVMFTWEILSVSGLWSLVSWSPARDERQAD